MTRHQIVAFLVTVFACGIFVGLGHEQLLADARGLDVGFAQLLESISLQARFEEIARGVLDIGDVFYYLVVVVFFMFLTYRVLQSKRA